MTNTAATTSTASNSRNNNATGSNTVNTNGNKTINKIKATVYDDDFKLYNLEVVP